MQTVIVPQVDVADGRLRIQMNQRGSKREGTLECLKIGRTVTPVRSTWLGISMARYSGESQRHIERIHVAESPCQ